MPTKTEYDAQTKEKVTREMTPEEVAELDALQPTVEQLEAQVQALADDLLQNSDRDKALALATVDLVMFAMEGGLTGMNRAQVRSAYRDRVIHYLRERRGILPAEG